MQNTANSWDFGGGGAAMSGNRGGGIVYIGPANTHKVQLQQGTWSSLVRPSRVSKDLGLTLISKDRTVNCKLH